MRFNCRDCGNTLSDDNQKRSDRADVCDSCWDTRMDLVEGKVCQPGGPEFVRIQRAMANGRGTAKRLIDKARAGL